jgi:hypothetical protein
MSEGLVGFSGYDSNAGYAPYPAVPMQVAPVRAVGVHDVLVSPGGDPIDPRLVVYSVLSTAGVAMGAYHGYKRNHDSIGAALGWAFLGGLFPFITIPVSLAQGFGERR